MWICYRYKAILVNCGKPLICCKLHKPYNVLNISISVFKQQYIDAHNLKI